MHVALPDDLPHVDWSILLRDATTDEALASHDAERQLRTASVGKVFLLAEAARQIEAGVLDPSERLGWERSEWVADSGLLYLLDPEPRSVADLCLLIGAVSDNLATNVVLRRVGLHEVTRAARDLGCTRTALLDRVRDDRGPDDPATLSVGTAAELSALMGALHRGEVFGAAASARVLRWLAAGCDLSMVAAAFDLDPLAHADPDRGITVINKTGTISTARIDTGLVRGPTATIGYAVAANWPAGTDPRDDVLAAMRRIGTAIRSAVGP